MKYLIASLALCILVCNQADCREDTKELTWRDVITWLPADIETLIVALGDFDPKEEEPGATKIITNSLGRQAMGGVRHQEFFSPYAKLIKTKLLWAMEGSRNFQPPQNQIHIGPFGYEGCHILVFSSDAKGDLDGLINDSLSKQHEEFAIQNKRVLKLKRDDNGDGSNYFIVHPQPNVLIVATQKAFLVEVLRRSEQPSKDRAFPKELPFWKQINTESARWGMHRLVDRHNVELHSKYKALGFTISFEPGKSDLCQLRYLGKELIVKGLLDPDKPQHPFKPIEKQVWECLIDTSKWKTDESNNSLYVLMLLGFLGHSVNI